MNERFPLSHSLLFFSLYLSAAAVARSGTNTVQFYWLDLVSCVVVWAYFLLLRVFDEHKDYAEDVQNHPQRVLQRGLITLTHLKWVGAVCVAATLFWSLARDQGVGPATFAWALMMSWTILMTMEFFCRQWLSARLMVYALSHMMVMPLLAWWCVQLALPGHGINANAGLLAALFFVAGLAFEITRKTRGPEEERPTVDSYSRVLGPRRAAWLVLLLVLVFTLLCALLSYNIQQTVRWPGYLLPAIGLLFATGTLVRFVSAPSLRGRKKNEIAIALVTLLGYASVIAAGLTQHA